MRQNPTTSVTRDQPAEGKGLGGLMGILRTFLILVGGTVAISIATHI